MAAGLSESADPGWPGPSAWGSEQGEGSRVSGYLSLGEDSRGLTPTAADPKEKLPSESVRGCSEKVLKASGVPFRVEGLKFGVESFTRNVASPHLVVERTQLRLEKRMRRKAEERRERTVGSGFGTRGALRSAIGASSATRNQPRWRIPTSGRPSTADVQET